MTHVIQVPFGQPQLTTFKARIVICALVWVFVSVIGIPESCGDGPARLRPHRLPPLNTSENLQQHSERLAALEAENAVLREKMAHLDALASCSPATRTMQPRSDCIMDPARCVGLPNLCEECFEELSWTKEGGFRIVPTVTIRGEAIQSQRVRLGSPVVLGLAPSTPGVNEDEITLHGKTSSLAFEATGPDVGCFKTSGGLHATLLNQLPLRNLSGYFVIRAYADFTNDQWRIRIGRDNDLFSPLDPSTVNMIRHKGAGNLGWFRGQFRVDRFLSINEQHSWTLSGSFSQPDVSDFLSNATIRGSDNGWPNVEGRIGLQFGAKCDGQSPLELGVSGVFGQLRAVDPGGVTNGATGPITIRPAAEVSEIWGVNLDAQVHGHRFGARGELFVGQGGGTYFMGVLQSLNPETARPIQAVGGWGEVYCKASSAHTFHLGCGIDDPRDQDLGFLNPMDPNDPGQTTLNTVAWVTWWYQATSHVRFGLEVSHRVTEYLDPTANSRGMIYHSTVWVTF